VDCHIRYDIDAGAAYIGIGAVRDIARTIQAGEDDSVMIDLDANGLVAGIELLDISEPQLFVTDRDRRKPERTIKVTGDLL
jgi:uncharacterized protein YuzE